MKLFVFLFFFFGMLANSAAQLCTGSLGDPVVLITFGDGINNTGYSATNSYVYTNSTCPNDGLYTITTNSLNCFNGTWHNVNQDHTGNGAFLLINASYTAGDFMVTNVKNLCPNTTYEFAAWLMNVMRSNGIKPNITFSIETVAGVVLQQFSTGDVPEAAQPSWNQYGFFFTVPVNTNEIVLRMTNNAPGGYGNDIAIDDITFRPCSNVTLNAAIQGYADTVRICDTDNSSFSFTSQISVGYVNPVFQWQISGDSGKNWIDIPGATGTNFTRTPTTAGLYCYRVTVNEAGLINSITCRIASNRLVIDIQKTPLVEAGADRILIAGNSVQLEGKVVANNPTYLWTPPVYLNNPTILNAIASPVADQQYRLVATTSNGCSASDSMWIKVVKDIFIPSAFTPNKDGKNDYWEIPYLSPDLDATVKVFNRYGQIVYTVRAKEVKWDGTYKGTLQPAGTYIYQIILKNGKLKKGAFLLLH